MQSDFNLQKINTKEFTDNLNATIDYGGNIFVVARRGSGKTSITSDVIAKKKLKEVYLNLSLFERPDIAGFPDFINAKKERFVRFLMPAFYKDLMEGDVPCVAVLDEVDKADNSLLAPLLEFVQARAMNGHAFKNLHAVVMTGNLQAEGGQKPPPTLLDRTEKYLVEMNPQHWLEWGANGEIHPSVSAYISDNLLDLSGEVDPGEEYASPSPRGWHNGSKIIRFGEKHKWHPQMILHKVAGCIGKKIGIKYAAFFEHYQVLLPLVDRIMKGEKIKEFKELEETKKLVLTMILCSRFAKLLDDLKEKNTLDLRLHSEISDISDNVAMFLANNVDPELSLIGMRSQIGMSRAIDFDLIENPSWDVILTNLTQQSKNE